MKSIVSNLIIVSVLILLFVTIGIISFKSYERGDRRTDAVSYESLYFLDNSLVNGTAVIEAIKHFSGHDLMILVKTKQADVPEVYNWDGDKQAEGYDEGRNSLESGYINKSALFKVKIYKENDRIVCVSFCQE